MSKVNKKLYSTTCPHCETLLKHSEKLRGKSVRCPKCEHPFQIPLPNQPERVDALFFPPLETDSSYIAATAKRTIPRARPIGLPGMWFVGGVIISAALLFIYEMERTPSKIGDLHIEETSRVSVVDATFSAIVGLVGLTFYFAPSIIAKVRGHRNFPPILVLNFLLGWTGLGWVGCLAWSLSSDVIESRQTIRQVIVHANERQSD